MRRRVVHAGFAAAVLCCAAWAGFEGWRLVDAQRSNADVMRAGAASGVVAESPRVRLAQAVALSKAGQRDAAAKLYDGLITSAELDEIGRAALFDLANMYLREAIAAGAGNPIASAPLVELAKNRYRELLRAKPDDWDARYNLERALWLQPESAQAFDDGREPDEVRRMIKVPDVALGDLP
jgi:mxaK protein